MSMSMSKRVLNEDRGYFLKERAERLQGVMWVLYETCIVGHKLTVFFNDDWTEETIKKLEELGFR